MKSNVVYWALALLLVGGGCFLSRDGTGTGDGLVVGGGPTTTSTGLPGGSGGTTTTSQAEDCLDGVDNDHDGAVDCDDDECSAYRCVPYLENAARYLVEGASCTSSTNTTLHDCSGCSCQPAGFTCPFTLTAHEELGCSGTTATWTTASCWDIADDANGMSFTLSVSSGSASCSPTVSTAAASDRQACAIASAGACSNGQACVPSELETGTCVLLAGEATCPDPYGNYSGTVSLDGQEACTCGCAPTSGTCPNSLSIQISAVNDVCTNTTSTTVQNCTDVYAQVHSVDVQNAPQGTVTCDATGTRDGTLFTLCCQ